MTNANWFLLTFLFTNMALAMGPKAPTTAVRIGVTEVSAGVASDGIIQHEITGSPQAISNQTEQHTSVIFNYSVILNERNFASERDQKLLKHCLSLAQAADGHESFSISGAYRRPNYQKPEVATIELISIVSCGKKKFNYFKPGEPVVLNSKQPM